jgi:hypothetical protein
VRERNIGGTDIKVVWKGKLAGNEIKITRTLDGGGPAVPLNHRDAGDTINARSLQRVERDNPRCVVGCSGC